MAAEARHVWRLYLDRALASGSGSKFDEALRHARGPADRCAVLGAQAAWHFDRGDFVKAARLFARIGAEAAAEAAAAEGADGAGGGGGSGGGAAWAGPGASLSFEAVALKFLDAKQDAALEAFVEEKLRLADPDEKVGQTGGTRRFQEPWQCFHASTAFCHCTCSEALPWQRHHPGS